MIRRAAIAAGALLGTFHVWLLGHQAWTGQLDDTATLGRWAMALVLVAALDVCRRRSGSLFGRQSIAIWVLAALLHGPALADGSERFVMPAVPEAVASVVQLVLSVAGLGLALLAALALASRRAAGRTRIPAWHAPRPLRRERLASGLAFLPRPPPAV